MEKSSTMRLLITFYILSLHAFESFLIANSLAFGGHSIGESSAVDSQSDHNISRRRVFISTATSTVSSLLFPHVAIGSEGSNKYAFETRDRNKNKDAIIRDDIW